VGCLRSKTKMEKREKLVYTVGEVAAMLGFSRSTVACLFEKEPGVIQLTRPETMHKRRYRSLRIPRSVYQRVLARLTK
jgi:predicted transcriptional regulator